MAAVLLLVGCVSPGPGAPGSGRDTVRTATSTLARYYGQEIAWSPCEDRAGVECGVLAVPLDHAQPDGEAVQVEVYRVPAWRHEARGAVVLLAGEAGMSGGDLFGPATFTFRELGASFDLVSYAPRAVAGTLALSCQDDVARAARLTLDATPDSPSEEDALVTAWQRYAQDCGEAGGDTLPVLGSADRARDLDILRAALGEKRLTLYGASSGALVAREYAGAFPEQAGRIVLDSPRPGSRPDDEASAPYVVEAADRAFDEALGTCFTNPFLPCPLGGTAAEARARVAGMLATLDAEPHDLGGGRVLTREHVVGAMWDAVAAGPQGRAAVVRALARASEGDWFELATHAATSLDRRTSDAAVASRCADRGPVVAEIADVRRRAAALAERSPLFGETVAWWSLECAGWPAGPTLETKRRGERSIRRGAALVVAASGDPRTPPGLPGVTSRLLADAPVLVYTGSEHGAYASSPCVRYVVNDFLTAGVVPANLTCGDLPLRQDWRRRGCVGACTVVPAAAFSRAGLTVMP